MKSKRLKILFLWAFVLGAMSILAYRYFARPSEPVYDGAPLSQWLDTTAGRGRPEKMMVVLKERVGVEALPWLVATFPSYERQIRSAEWYGRWCKTFPLVSRIFGRPGTAKLVAARLNAMSLLSRLAPGTVYEPQVAQLIASIHQPPGRDRQLLETKMYSLGRFTNCPSIAVPVLLAGLSNPAVFEASVTSLRAFPAVATPRLYTMALAETGGSARFALRRINEDAYRRLCEERGLAP